MLKCHCACSSEIETCVINDAGKQAAHKRSENLPFDRISPNDVL